MRTQEATHVTQIVAVDPLLLASQDSLTLQLGMARVKLNQQHGCQVVPRPWAPWSRCLLLSFPQATQEP